MHRETLSPTKRRSFEKIVASAQFLFDRFGIEHTTMKEIADESGLSRFTVYNLFKNKEEIVTSVVINCLEEIYVQVDDLNTDADIQDEAKRLFHQLLDIYLEKDYALRILISYYREYRINFEFEEVMFKEGSSIEKIVKQVRQLVKNNSNNPEEEEKNMRKFLTIYNYIIGVGMRYSSRKSMHLANPMAIGGEDLHIALDYMLKMWDDDRVTVKKKS